uniref:Protein SSUH2 homolog isoform X1 n=2 Tax=Phascolarctos cinereus TaxID=38626 RepID=A0A6P5JED6_PHACI|nr:protein SSUH2 homolog isoform X1 [Phascolarctos cinereus]
MERGLDRESWIQILAQPLTNCVMKTLGIMDLSYEAESPLAPPVELLEQLAHYSWPFQGQTQSSLPSTSLRKLSDQRNRPIFLQHSIPVMTEEMARNALLSFVNSRCCYGNRAAGELVIQDLRQQMLYRYRLETFSESRLSEWTFQPYTNHSVDGPKKGASPRPWDIKVHVPPMFQEETKKFQVPHSSLVKDCHKCQGRGRYKCSGCHGAGTMRCASCSGAKRKAKQSRRCQVCSGSGRKRCSTCSGRGNKTCATCKGEKKLLHFIQLVITWKNSLFEFVTEHHMNFPEELLAKVRGENIFKDENAMVYPIVDFPKQEISLASQRGIAEHTTALAGRSRVLQQFPGRWHVLPHSMSHLEKEETISFAELQEGLMQQFHNKEVPEIIKGLLKIYNLRLSPLPTSSSLIG